MINHKLFNKLLKDEKKVDATLYTSGPMWRYQNFKISYQIREQYIDLLDVLGMLSQKPLRNYLSAKMEKISP